MGIEKSTLTRLLAIVLALLTAASVGLGWVNFTQEGRFQQPTDGVWWSESPNGLLATRVLRDSPGTRAGIKAGDVMMAANDRPTRRLADLERQKFKAGIYGKIVYSLRRGTVWLDVPVILEAPDRTLNLGLRIIALVYLSIGLYVLLRRWTAPHSTHFYLFCLVSFVLYAFKYTGKLNLFDWIIYWGNVVAWAIQPALFLHFSLAFSHPSLSRRIRKGLTCLLYLPAVALILLQVAAIQLWAATGILRHRIDKISIAYLAAYYMLAALLFTLSYRQEDSTLRRQQLKWLTRGTLLSVAPFTLLYALPYLMEWPVNDLVAKIAHISLVILPLTFSWAIVRYRLMDTDLIFKRGVTYTLATAALVGMYFAIVGGAAELVHARLPWAREWGLIAGIIITALLFDPLKRMIQDRVDRVFDRKRYDYRQTLIDFGRGLSTQTNMQTLLASITESLPRILLVSRVAVLLSNGNGTFRLGAAYGLPSAATNGSTALDLSFLNFDSTNSGSHLFLEAPQQALLLSGNQQKTSSLLELNYYLPCRVQSKAIAVIGLGRTNDGDFLSSEDVEMLESLAGYIGIALQNAQLYQSLEQKISEYERLKEFSENIVESINVGILAIDLDHKIDSWNTQMESMYALSRSETVGRHVGEVFPQSLLTELELSRNQPGVHNLYKFVLQTGAGESRVANIAIAPLLSRNFEVLGRIILVDDITDQVNMENQLAQADKLSSIGLLAAGVAHEVNTPLAVISSYTQMLSKQLGKEDRLAPLLERITQQTFRASEIVNNLLNFSRTAGSEFRDTDVNQVIRETAMLLEHQMRTAQIEVEMELDPVLPPIFGNPNKLQQVFLNLILNAKDAMTHGGRLRIVSRVDTEVHVEVSDSGSGISPENLRRIYDPFFTTKSVPVEGQKRGTGLGLAVTYGIIQEHAGKITVESQPGNGTTFHLHFPFTGDLAVQESVKSSAHV